MNTDKIYAEQLANEYAPKDTSKVVALCKLDARDKLPAVIFTYTLSVISALVFGLGMCLAMGQIGAGTTGHFVLGISSACRAWPVWASTIRSTSAFSKTAKRNTPLRAWSLSERSARSKL